MKLEHQYLQLLADLLNHGNVKTDRTGTGTTSLFGRQLRSDLELEFPLLTTKRLHWKSIVEELLWMLRGETNAHRLRERGVTIWDEWADPLTGRLGPVYGAQWRRWTNKPNYPPIDQIARALDLLKKDPDSRRNVVSAWNVTDLPEMALTPCHCLFQFYVANGRLSTHMYQRSADIFLGVPFNIASYALLTHIMAHCADLKVGELIISFGDVHLYSNHREQAREQIGRGTLIPPSLSIYHSAPKLPWEFGPEDISLEDYCAHPPIKAPVAV